MSGNCEKPMMNSHSSRRIRKSHQRILTDLKQNKTYVSQYNSWQLIHEPLQLLLGLRSFLLTDATAVFISNAIFISFDEIIHKRQEYRNCILNTTLPTPSCSRGQCNTCFVRLVMCICEHCEHSSVVLTYQSHAACTLRPPVDTRAFSLWKNTWREENGIKRCPQ